MMVAAALAAGAAMLSGGSAVGQSGGCAFADAPEGSQTADLEAAVVCLVNERRQARGLAPLKVSVPLANGARAHAADMASRNYFSHTDPEGRDAEGRVTTYEGAILGETIYWGTGTMSTPRAAVEDWMSREADAGILLDRDADEIGAGVVDGTPTEREDGRTYAADIGSSTGPTPEAGKTVVVERVAGRVLVQTPGTGARASAYRELGDAEEVPVGATLNADAGTVRLTSAASLSGARQKADFFKGTFKVKQKRAKVLVTELQLKGTLACGRTASASAKKKVRRLWGRGRGRFRTRGRRASATVRGTEWLTEDRCNGTLIRVKKGLVEVKPAGRRYFKGTRKSKVLVKAGNRFLAKR